MRISQEYIKRSNKKIDWLHNSGLATATWSHPSQNVSLRCPKLFLWASWVVLLAELMFCWITESPWKGRCSPTFEDPLKTRHLALVPETASLGNLYQQLSGAKMGLATSKGRIETYMKHYTVTILNIWIIHLTSRMSICIVFSKHGILYIIYGTICWHLAAYSPLRVLALWPLSIEDLFGWRV